LFTPGSDYLVASSSREMERALAGLLADRGLSVQLAQAGRAVIEARHTCAHRVSELFAIHRELWTAGQRPGRPTELNAGASVAASHQEVP
jgi:spore maturation protein CgeB